MRKLLKFAINIGTLASASYFLYQGGSEPIWVGLCAAAAFVLGASLGEAWEEFLIGIGWAENQKTGLKKS